MLKNNAQDMKTVVETFFIEETQSLVYSQDDLTKWSDLCSFLELPNQASLSKEEMSPVPFLWMNSALYNIMSTLCPRKEGLIEYNKTPIPLEALEVIALSKREKYFDLIEVWYDEGSPDPCIIGYIFDGTRNDDWMKKSYAKKYLLARWADVKSSLKELTQRAYNRFVSEQKISLQENIRRQQRELEDLELTAARRFGLIESGSSFNLF